MKYFPHTRSDIAILLKILWNCREVSSDFPPVVNEVVNFSGVWTAPCEEGGSARRTDRLLYVSPLQEETFLSEIVYVWRVDLRMYRGWIVWA